LKFPALNIREAHERPEAMEEGAVMMVGVMKERVLQGISVLTSRLKKVHDVTDYTSDNVSDKVVKIIISYINYIRTNIWKCSIL
jgi:UDP-N-acetylglucosamine 2-epimerase (non-hydrolysing)